jgi:hypothetical protein
LFAICKRIFTRWVAPQEADDARETARTPEITDKSLALAFAAKEPMGKKQTTPYQIDRMPIL